MAYTITVAVTDVASAAALPDCKVWVTSDEAGDVLLYSEYTGSAGTCTFSLDDGTYYFWARLTAYTFDNPQEVVVSGAAAAVSIEGTAASLVAETETQICNDALALLGSGIDVPWLDDYATDTTDTAQWCRKLLDATRRSVLANFTFVETVTFLAGTDSGGDDSSVVHPDWLYAYPLPTNPVCLRLLGLVVTSNVNGGGWHYLLDWERYQSYVLTDYATSDFYWHYIRDETDYSVLSQPTRDAIAYLLASKLAAPVVRGPESYARRRELLQEYELYARKYAIAFNQKQLFNAKPDGDIQTIDIT